MRGRGIILAAGSSVRLGRPKALLSLAGETFLGRLVRVFFAGGTFDVSVVVGGTHEEAILREVERLRTRWSGLGVVRNPDPSPGPISSIRAAVAGRDFADEDGALIHPVDIPAVEATDIRSLLDAASAHAEADAVVPSVGWRRAHPVFLRARLAARVLTLAEGRTLRDLLSEAGVRVHHVVRENRLLLHDVDNEADYEELRRRLEP